MASGWVKSLQCKSRAFDDVVSQPNPKLLVPSYSCRKSAQSLKDVIETRKPKKPEKTEKTERKKSEPVSGHYNPPARTRNRNPDPFFPSLNELPEGHASRNVVEIIFHTSWGPKPFPGRVEVIFKVQNGSRTVTRFEEYRETVKTRQKKDGKEAREEDVRCAADGNEMMRFYCLGPTGRSGGGGAWGIFGGKGGAICTFSGSGGAHERGSGGGWGRRGMLVCRVIAGRVGKRVGFDSLVENRRVGFDSVRGDEGELLVFDPRAVLPCFLIIYKL